MPQFNASAALLLKRFIESGVTSPEELSNVMGNASVATGSFSTMDERFGYRSVEQVVGAVKSACTRNTREEIQAAIDSKDPEQMAHILYDNRADLPNANPGDRLRVCIQWRIQLSGVSGSLWRGRWHQQD